MKKEEKKIECYVLGQRNTYGHMEYLIDDIVKDRTILENYLYQTGYICDSADGTCWQYRLKTSNHIDFCIRKIRIPTEVEKTASFTSCHSGYVNKR